MPGARALNIPQYDSCFIIVMHKSAQRHDIRPADAPKLSLHESYLGFLIASLEIFEMMTHPWKTQTDNASRIFDLEFSKQNHKKPQNIQRITMEPKTEITNIQIEYSDSSSGCLKSDILSECQSSLRKKQSFHRKYFYIEQ